MDLITLVFGIAVSGVVLTLLYGLQARGRAGAIEEDRLYSVATPLTLEEVELSQPFSERILKPTVTTVLQGLGRLTPQRNLQDLQQRLVIAGRPFGWTVASFLGLRMLSAMLLTALAFILTLFSGDQPLSRRIILALAMGGFGYYLPLLWLNWYTRRRQRALVRALPDGLDMLNICVGAGLGFDAALSRVGEQWKTPLSEEFNRVVAEIRLGKTRRQALRDLSRRTQVPEIENFVATIVQADQLGVSIAKVLRTHAEQMRIFRRQKAEEQARQATIKLLFPLVFMIFPAMLAVLLGPAIPQLLETLGGL